MDTAKSNRDTSCASIAFIYFFFLGQFIQANSNPVSQWRVDVFHDAFFLTCLLHLIFFPQFGSSLFIEIQREEEEFRLRRGRRIGPW